MSTISSSSILSKVTLLAMLKRDKVTSIVGQLYRNVFMVRVALGALGILSHQHCIFHVHTFTFIQ